MIYCRQRIDKTKWHPWFAWHPVRIARQQEGCVIVIVRAWLETIWRKGEYSCGWGEGCWNWEYAMEAPDE